MNLKEMLSYTLSLIEEINPESEYLTDDPDIQTKIKSVTNHIMYEMARFKKIPKYIEFDVNSGETIDFDRLERECGSEVYQISSVGGIGFELKADGTIIKVTKGGTAQIELYIYPERITEKTKLTAYEFELSPDVLEIMPYGIAADLLKSDVSAEYGKVYANRYEYMLQRLDSRFSTSSICVEGGYDI